MNTQQKISKILAVSGLSQEALAGRLGVSFVTLNSWVNQKSKPTRSEYISRIDTLYVEYFGELVIDQAELSAKKLSAHKCKLTATKLRSNRELLDEITLNLTYNTNTIEGSTMTETDVANVIFDHKVLKNRTAIEQREATNHQTALNFLVDELADKSQPFVWSIELIKSIHLRLMNGIIADAGVFRNHTVRIVGANIPLVNFIKIPERLENLCNRLNEESTDPIGLLGQTHAEFEQIHPFTDGNGRTGRLILFAQALRFGMYPPIIAKDRKNAYYHYLALAQTKEKFDNLELLLAESIISSATKNEEWEQAR